jgi:NAD-dependent SIR2 family protein deacetylase
MLRSSVVANRMEDQQDAIVQAAEAIASAKALMVGAGAGMGVDSGLPDFRGQQGFWRAYPPLAKLGLDFVDMANPMWFDQDPELAWGFYGHRLNLYRATAPHGGFGILRRWAGEMEGGLFVFTSNVDGQFQKAGYAEEEIVECHGSIHHLQCGRVCRDVIWSAAETVVEIDERSFRAVGPLPKCPACSGIARPNILMFGDWGWVPHRSSAQEVRLQAWLSAALDQRLAVMEFGAGRAVPTVRSMCERVASRHGGTLIRVNPREPEGPPGTISIETPALETLRSIDTKLGG